MPEPRLPDLETLRQKVAAWEVKRNEQDDNIDWQFTTDDARTKLKSIGIGNRAGSHGLRGGARADVRAYIQHFKYSRVLERRKIISVSKYRVISL